LVAIKKENRPQVYKPKGDESLDFFANTASVAVALAQGISNAVFFVVARRVEVKGEPRAAPVTSSTPAVDDDDDRQEHCGEPDDAETNHQTRAGNSCQEE